MVFGGSRGQVLVVANLQSYLQYVLLFQPKTPRVYWQLALLSLGQVAIASTLVPGPLFGMMLLVYLMAGSSPSRCCCCQPRASRFAAARRCGGPAGAASCAAATVPRRRCWTAASRRWRRSFGRGLARAGRGRRAA